LVDWIGFPDGFQIPIDATGVPACLAIMESNVQERVSWLQSFWTITSIFESGVALVQNATRS
jgi:hypothetical protein